MTDSIILQGGAASLLGDAAAGTGATSGLSVFAGRSSGDAAWGFSSGSLAAAPDAFARSLSGTLRKLLERLDTFTWPEADAASGTALAHDPDAPVTLAPGVYTLPGSGAQIRVAGGDTWGQLAARMAATFGSAGLAEISRLVPVSRGVLSEAGMERLARGLSDVLAAHNEAADLLARKAGERSAEAAGMLSAPARKHAYALATLGVERSGGRLWLFGEAFLSAVAEDADGARATLFGQDGFLPALRGAADQALAALGAAADSGETVDPVARIFGSATPAGSGADLGGIVDRYDAGESEGGGVLSATRLLRSLG